MHSAGSTMNERRTFVLASSQLCHPERRKIVRSRTILRSRGTPRLLAPVKRSKGVLPRNLSERVRSGNASREQEQTPGYSGSFDSRNELAGESVPSAQEDNFESRKATNHDLAFG